MCNNGIIALRIEFNTTWRPLLIKKKSLKLFQIDSNLKLKKQTCKQKSK